MTARRIRTGAAAATLIAGIAQMIVAANERGQRTEAGLGPDVLIDAIFGARYVLFLAGLASVVAVGGLYRGRRNAWWLASGAALVSILRSATGMPTIEIVGLGIGVAMLLVLLCGRRSFTVTSGSARARPGLGLIVGGLAGVYVYGTVGLYVLDWDFRGATTLWQAAREAARLLFLLPTSTIEPVSRHGSWFLDSVRFGSTVVVLLGVTRMVAAAVHRPERLEDETVRQLLGQWGCNALAPFCTLADTRWMITEDRQAFVAFKVVGTTAVALGEPVGEPQACVRAVAEFVAMSQSNGWIVGFHQVTPLGADTLGRAGLELLKIGEEAIVPVQDWSLDAKYNKSLRSALRRVERAGYELVELDQPIDHATMVQLRDVSDSWLGDGEHRERTFTVGQFDPDYLRRTTVLAVRHAEVGAIVAFANVLPSFRSPVGNFDLMRRRPDAPNGVMELLFVGLIERFRTSGYQGMALGLAPFANVSGTSPAARVSRLIYERGENAFHYQGLRRFKEKWKPVWEPRYLAYQRPADLPKVAIAVARAGELPRRRRLFTSMQVAVQRFPVSVAIIGVMLWFMAATAISPPVHVTLVRHFGLDWRDLTRLRLWRLPTSQLLAAQPGFAWAKVALAFVALPIAEWRIGSRRTVITFFAADWLATLVTFVGLRISSGLGSGWSVVLLNIRDVGPSAGAWALLVVVAMSFRRRTLRVASTVAAVGFLVAALVIHGRLFDIEHALAAGAALGAGIYRQRARADAVMCDRGAAGGRPTDPRLTRDPRHISTAATA